MLYFDLAVIFYILSFLLLIVNFHFNKMMLQALQTVFTGVAALANIVALMLHWQDMRQLHSYSIFDLMVFVALALAIVYLLMNLKYKRPYLGLFLLPMIIIAGLVALFAASESPADNLSFAMDNLWLYLHIPLIVIGTAFFLTAFATGLMYFIMEQQLKKKKFGKIFERFPSLDMLDRINRAALYIGFGSYTAGILCAAGWVSFRVTHASLFANNPDLGASFQLKLFFAMLVWVMLGIILLLKTKRGMTARQTALASIMGFVAVLFAYAAVALFIVR
ncbi:MAG: cytochrome c biogenesis protein [Deferribacteraceae bacterium]|jgi:ABC-type transport system involved in cytochrome c biogenesis permease subunit|nr:cytochrome c biogenesis protein [Deferribacteraceae bacterium]